MKFEPPQSSEAHRSLIGAVEKVGLDAVCLRRLLWLINAHPTLIAHARVFEHVLMHLNSATFQAPALVWAGSWSLDIPDWIQICTWISSNRQALMCLSGLQSVDRDIENKHPMVGEGVDRHGVVAALWSKHQSSGVYPPTHFESTPSAIAYFGIQGHLLASYIDSRHRLSTLDFYEAYSKEAERPVAPSRTGVVSLAFRELSHNKYSPLVAQIPLCDCTADFVGRLRGEFIKMPGLQDDVEENGSRHVASIRRYFLRFGRVLNGWMPPQTLRQGWGGSGGHARRHGFIHPSGPSGIYLEDAIRPPSDPEIPRLIGQKILIDLDADHADDPNAVEASGLAPDETLEEVFRLYTPDELKGRLYAARYQRFASEASAQTLPFDYSQLTPQELHEINTLASARIAAYTDQKTADKRTRLLAVSGLIVRIMLCFGQPMQAAWAVRCVWVTVSSPDKMIEPTGGQLTLVIAAPSEANWSRASVIGFCLPGIMPNYKSSLPESLEEIDQDSVDSFVLPDIHGLGQQLLQFMQSDSSSDLNGFGVRVDTAREAVSEFVGTFKDQRITQDKIAKTLSSIIKYQTGDQSLAWMVTADSSNANQPRMHYTRHSVTSIVNAYIRASRRLASFLGTEPIASTLQHPIQSGSSTLGARFVIAKTEVQDMLTRLVNQLKERYQSTLSQRAIRRYHSLYLLYTTIYQSILTSIRAVTAPNALYLAWNQSDQHHDDVRASLSDKDSRYSDRARPVTIISALSQQFSHYKLHREYLPKRLPVIAPWMASLGEQHPFFVITPDFLVEPLTPTWVKMSLKEYTGYDVPENFHRAFIRTELLARNCPADIIDAHLGHANFGESPFSKFSSFDYRLHFDRIQAALQEIHDDLGLQPIGSRVVPHKVRIGSL